MASEGEHLSTYRRAIKRGVGLAFPWFLMVLEAIEIDRKLLYVVFRARSMVVLERLV